MEMIFLIIAVPLLAPWIFKICWPHEMTWLEMTIASVSGIVIAIIVYVCGMVGQTHDVEIWNGQVTGKSRVHDTYEESYSCNPHTVTSGFGKNQTTSTEYDTCWRTHYTVTWTSKTDLGNYTVKKLDWESRSVYNSPDPANYLAISIGDPVAKTSAFTNYVKAVPDSLFHANLTNNFDKLIPPYPNKVYDMYRLNRALTMGVNVPDLDKWNQDISLALRRLGPQKQANVIVVFVNTPDQNYIHALEGKWIGGKKNDIIVVLGVTNYPKIDWVAISSWTDSQIFKVQLRDDITKIGQVDRSQIIKAIETNTYATFKRKNMKDFEYLKEQIVPPVWVLTIAALLGILVTLCSSLYFYRNNPFK